MKKGLCLLLCVVMLLGIFVACGGNDEPADSKASEGTTDSNRGGETTAPSSGDNPGGETTVPPSSETFVCETPPPIICTLPPGKVPVDFDMSFTVLVRQNRHAWFWGTDKSTDEVSKAAYKRNNLLNEMYNIEIEILENASDASTWRTTLNAADGTVHLAIPDAWWALEYEGVFINLLRRIEIDPSESHWIRGWNDNQIINNRLYGIVGDASLEVMENWEVLFYNRDMAKDLGYYEDIFNLVENGQWTVKEMMEIMDDFELALMDNDPSNDVWGAVYDSGSMVQQLYSAGLSLLEINRYTNILFDVSNTPKNIALTEDVRALRHHKTMNYQSSCPGSDMETKSNLFLAERTFFFGSDLLNGKAIKKSADFDYGVLVMPKHDAADDYRTGSYGVSFFTIPHSSSNKHASAVVLNTMNYLSGDGGKEKLGEDILVDTFFETVVRTETSHGAEDFAMLDRIKKSAYYAFSFIAQNKISLQDSFVSSVHNNKSIAATMDDVTKKAEDGIFEMMTFYGDARYAE